MSVNSNSGNYFSSYEFTSDQKESSVETTPSRHSLRSPSPSLSPVKPADTVRQTFINDLLKPRGNFEKFSSNIMSKLIRRNPEILKEISQFKNNYKTHINLLKEKSWKEWSDPKNKGDKMATELIGEKPNEMTMADFRKVAKKFQEKITGMAGEAAGFAKMTWNAAGTDSYKSDIDNFCTPENKNAPQLDQIATKILSEVTWQTVFEGVASTQIDLESYLDHPGASRNTEAQLKTSEGRAQFTRLELTMSALDMKRAFGNDQAGWKAYTGNFIGHLSTSELKNSFSKIFQEAENFDQALDREIREQMLLENPNNSFTTFEIKEFSNEQLQQLTGPQSEIMKNDSDAYKKAALTFKTGRTMELSAQMDADVKTISGNLSMMEKINAQKHRFEKNKDIASQKICQQAAERYKKLQDENDMLEVRIAARGALRNAMFDETYLTQGAYNRVCYVEGGQLTSQIVQQNIEKLRRYSSTGSFSELNNIQKQATRAPSRLEKLISTTENISKLTHKLNSYEEGSHAIDQGKQSDAIYLKQQLAIEGSKYSERGNRGNVEVFEEIAEKISLSKGSETADGKEAIAKLEHADVAINLMMANGRTSKSTMDGIKKLALETAAGKKALRSYPPKPLEVKKVVDEYELKLAVTLAAVKDAAANFPEVIKAEGLVDAAENLHEKASELLRAKRQDRLNMTSTFNELKEVLKDEVEIDASEELQIKQILNAFEAGGMKGDQEEINQQEKLGFMVVNILSLLEQNRKVTFHTDEGTQESFDVQFPKISSETQKKIETILKARVGFSRFEDPAIQELHKRSEKITLSKLELNNSEDIDHFHSETNELMAKALNLSITHGIIPSPGVENREYVSLSALLNESKSSV